MVSDCDGRGLWIAQIFMASCAQSSGQNYTCFFGFFFWLVRLCPVQGRGLHPEEGPFGEELPKELQPLAGQELAGHGANVGTA